MADLDEPTAADPPATWFDHHCHLPGDPAAAADVVAGARAVGVARLLDVGTDVASSQAAAQRAAGFDDVWATAGVHPHDASTIEAGGQVNLGELEALLERPEVVAVGEIGLDYHYDHSPRSVQRQVFAEQLGLAQRRDLPVVIHTREAWDDTFDILTTVGVPRRGVLHCFTGGPAEAGRALELGLSLSFSGIATFPSAGEVRQAAQLCPLERILVETDSPYLAPVPHRGKKNRPAWVVDVGTSVAETVGVAAEELAAATWSNASALYGLD